MRHDATFCFDDALKNLHSYSQTVHIQRAHEHTHPSYAHFFVTRAHLPDAGFAALCGCAGMWLLLARVRLCEDL